MLCYPGATTSDQRERKSSGLVSGVWHPTGKTMCMQDLGAEVLGEGIGCGKEVGEDCRTN